MSKPIPLKSLSDLAQCKPVMELSSLLDTKHKQSFDVLEAAFASREDNSIGSNSSNTSFAKHSCLIIAKETNPALHYLKHIVEKNGWRAILGKHGDGEDALRVLKLRNWGKYFRQVLSHVISQILTCTSTSFVLYSTLRCCVY